MRKASPEGLVLSDLNRTIVLRCTIVNPRMCLSV